jgi:hypothetical protein
LCKNIVYFGKIFQNNLYWTRLSGFKSILTEPDFFQGVLGGPSGSMVFSMLPEVFCLCTACGEPLGKGGFVPHKNASCGAGFVAGGLAAFFAKTLAEITFYSESDVLVELHGAEGAGFHTGLTPDAGVFVDQHDTVFILIDCFDRAGFGTRRISAMVTVYGDEIRAFFHHPDQPGADAQGMLLFAGDLACVASHAVVFKKYQ